MVWKLTEKNKYGGHSWHISIGTGLRIFIHESDNSSSLIVEFKELKLLGYKTHFAFISNENLETTFQDSIERVFTFMKNHKDFLWSESQKETKKAEVMDLFYQLTNTKPSDYLSNNNTEWEIFLAHNEVTKQTEDVFLKFFIPDWIYRLK